MTEKEYKLIHSFVQAFCDESFARPGVAYDGGHFYMFTTKQVNALLKNIALLINEENEENDE